MGGEDCGARLEIYLKPELEQFGLTIKLVSSFA